MSSHLILHIYFEDESTGQGTDAPLFLAEAIDLEALTLALELEEQPQRIAQVDVEYR